MVTVVVTGGDQVAGVADVCCEICWLSGYTEGYGGGLVQYNESQMNEQNTLACCA